jgi:hypothetical protein
MRATIIGKDDVTLLVVIHIIVIEDYYRHRIFCLLCLPGGF